MTTELFDLETSYKIKKAAPVVSSVTRDAAEMVVKALASWTETHQREQDITRKYFWQTSLGDLIAYGNLSIDPYRLGKILRSLSLTLWRKTGGFHVAWSEEQLSILQEYFSD